MKKKILSLLLAISVIFGMFGMLGVCAEQIDGAFRYSVLNGEATVLGCVFGSDIGEITVPATLGGEPVKHIAENAFASCEEITKITLPDTLISIGKDAFSGCTALEFKVEDGAKYLGTSTNDYFALIKATSTSITACAINGNTTLIADYAFDGCASVFKIRIPGSVKYIGIDAFNGCSFLTQVLTYDIESWCAISFASPASNPLYYAHSLFVDGIDSAVTIPSTVENIRDFTFYGCQSMITLDLPSTLTGVDNSSFSGCDNLKTVNYDGGISDKSLITVGENNDALLKALWVYKPCTEHIYDDVCDAVCNECGYVREDVHVFDEAWSFDTDYHWHICTACRSEKSGNRKHIFDNACDTTCNTCGYKRTITHSYKDVIKRATLTKNGSVTPTCTVCGKTKTAKTIYYPKTIKLSATTYTYDGNTKRPTVTVTGSNGKTISSSNYTATYASGRKNVGKYSVKITFKGNYSGSKTLYFTIKPKATSISKLTATVGGFKATVKKLTTQTTGYQLQYSTSSKFTSAKTVTISKNTTTSKTVSKLTKGKKYYVRVRTYKTVSGTKYYSSWSPSKYVTTKKK